MPTNSAKALFLCFDEHIRPALPAAANILFINAGPGTPEGILCQQYFKPDANRLAQAGYGVLQDIPESGTYDIVMVCGGKQHKETRFFMARALCLLKPGGTLLCAAAGDMGGKRLKKDLSSVGLNAREMAKFHARVVWASVQVPPENEALTGWLKDGAVQNVKIGEASYKSQPGIFGWDKVDKGSALLVAYLPEDLPGNGADFGCGYGYLARHVADKGAGTEELYVIDADARAIAACGDNLSNAGFPVQALWADLTMAVDGLPSLDWIVMNPPFHEGKATKDSIGQKFIETAAHHLKSGGRLWMVANAHLPYEASLKAHFKSFTKLVEQDGFKVFEARK